ncbi:unnamed protein product [Blepharisma stoltei]|uniref:TmcB/TmcC TPR repeats domain-containing protein n=1 Tax=Blepharisma stoltei TaxID=1481888 RepID=A0AAU9IWS1_9CILI|nr:unnamed protein product [Blepharisma stoltei]
MISNEPSSITTLSSKASYIDYYEESLPYKTLKVDSKAKNTILEAIFEVYLLCFFIKSPKRQSIIKQRIKTIFINIIFACQIISFLWTSNTSINGWESNVKVWNYIGSLRFDNLCIYFDAIDLCLYSSIMLSFTCIFGAALMVIAILLKRKISKLFARVLGGFYFFFSDFIYIPSITLLLICVKYSVSTETYALEYQENNKASSFQLSPILIPWLLLLLIFIFFIVLLKSAFCGDTRHSKFPKVVSAKAHSIIEIYTVLYSTIISVFYVFFAIKHIILCQIITMILSLVLVYKTVKSFPYFSPFNNCIVVVRFLIISTVSFAFIFGKWINTAYAISLLSFVFVPSLSLIAIEIVVRAYQKSIRNRIFYVETIKNGYELELLLRQSLWKKKTEIDKSVIRVFADCYLKTTLHEVKLLAIWEANFCFYSLKDETLAKVKLHKAKYSSYSLEGSYHEYLCRKIFSESAKLNENTKFLDYINDFNKLKKEDEFFCVLLQDFWREIILRKPNLNKIKSIMLRISNSVLFLNQEYTRLITSFPKSSETLLLYSTLLQKIFFNNEKAIPLLNRQHSLNRILKHEFEKKFSVFDENNGIILASWGEKEDQGKIFFANPRVADMVKHPIDELIGNNISIFIPHPYDHNFASSMNYYLQYCSKSDLKLPPFIYLLSPNGYLVEFMFKASITSLSNILTLFILLKESNTNHQIALISETGEIYAHSELFNLYTNLRYPFLKGFYIFDVFPNLKFSDIIPNTLIKLQNKSEDTYIVFSFWELDGIKINYVLIIDDPNELQDWNIEKYREIEDVYTPVVNKIFPLPKFGFLSSISEYDIIKNDPSGKQIKNETTGIVHSNDITQPKDWGLYEDEGPTHSISQSSSAIQKKNLGIKLREDATRTIKIFNIILISAITISTLANVAVVLFTVIEAMKLSDLKIAITLGKLEYSLITIANSIRDMQFQFLLYPNELPSSVSDLQVKISDLEDLHANISFKLSDWDLCRGKNIFIEEAVPVWKGNIIENEKLINTISEFIGTGKDVIRKANSLEDFSSEGKYIVSNGYGSVFRYTNSSLYDFARCQHESIVDLTENMNYLLLSSFAILIVCIVVLIPFTMSIENMFNSFWNHIKAQACDAYFDLRQNCLDRLYSIHGQNDAQNLPHNTKYMSKTANMKSPWRYIWRISLFLLCSLLFFLINYVYIYPNGHKYVKMRPLLIKTLISRKISYVNLVSWSRETKLDDQPLSLEHILNTSYQFPEPGIKLNSLYANALYSNKLIRNPKYEVSFNSDFIKYFYEDMSHQNEIFKYGVYSAGNIILFDVHYHSMHDMDADSDQNPDRNMTYKEENDKEWLSITEKAENLANIYDDLINYADDQNMYIIQRQVMYVLIVLVFYILYSACLYLFFYVPFLAKEKANLKKMETIMTLIPAHDNKH